MSKIPFDLKYRSQIESGEYKVETRSGLPARIVCWDRKAKDMEILALVYDEHIEEDNEDIAEVALNGKMFPRGKNHDYDLFIVTPEEELTEFEKAIKDMIKPYAAWLDDIFKEESAKLLFLAREQFIKDGYIIEKKAFHDAVEKINPEVMKEVSENIDLENFIHDLSERYPEVSFAKLTRIAKAVYDYGKAQALKDLPRWRKWGNGACGGGKHPIALVESSPGHYFLADCLGITDEKYIMLSDLEKLPGFKED